VPDVLIEAAVESIVAVRAAERHGAGRIELCADLDGGGVTPSPSLLEEAVRVTRLPIHVMIRPRGGNFVYDASEVEAMCAAAADARAAGAAGIVTGALSPDGSLDLPGIERIRIAAGPLATVVHRAFDQVSRPRDALDELIELGVAGVLTAGGSGTAAEGIPRLRQLADAARGRLEIIAGGSVSAADVVRIVRDTGVRVIHARCGNDGGRIAGIVGALSKR